MPHSRNTSWKESIQGSFRRYLPRKSYLPPSLNGTNKHRNATHTTEESKKILGRRRGTSGNAQMTNDMKKPFIPRFTPNERDPNCYNFLTLFPFLFLFLSPPVEPSFLSGSYHIYDIFVASASTTIWT